MPADRAEITSRNMQIAGRKVSHLQARDCSVNRGLGGTGQSLRKLASFEIFLQCTFEIRLNKMYNL